MSIRLIMCWSGGKDSAHALHRLHKDDRFTVTGLLTTVTEEYERISMRPVFPIWGEPTDQLAKRTVTEGFWATLCCVDPVKLSADWAGRAYDQALLDSLPPEIDPCGENGEFHTFVHNSPGFVNPIATLPGETVHRDGFVFHDLLLE